MYLDHGFRLGLAVALSSLLILLLFSIVEIILRRTRVASSRSYLDSFRSDANSKKQIAARSPKHFSITLTFCFPSLGVIFSTGALAEMAKKKKKTPTIYSRTLQFAVTYVVHHLMNTWTRMHKLQYKNKIKRRKFSASVHARAFWIFDPITKQETRKKSSSVAAG
jgi:hypothetical protein